jgi:TPR repeat protein
LIKIYQASKSQKSQKHMKHQARQYITRAAELGHVPAYFYMGWIHEFGIDTDPNREEAGDWYALSANNRDPQAYFKLALW